ncbi:UDP-glucuronosyltransferase 2A1-like [Paramormyrops kingsleyae]|uniref:UDP-glucuronosyltransferase 2A1-like n=1 Tax=Paramormyrops kingsleyae TaxID=1676925 RepID=UPI003B9704F6
MKFMYYGLAYLFLQSYILQCTDCSKILVWYAENSHWINLKPVLGRLVERGHDVTVVTPNATLSMDPTEDSPWSYKIFNTSVSVELMKSCLEEFISFSMYEMDHLNLLEIFSKFYQMANKNLKVMFQTCNELLESEHFMESLKKDGFQVILVDPIYPCGELVAAKLGIPLVYTLRFSVANVMERLCGQLPAPPSFVPGAMSKYTDQMGFIDRMMNLLFYWSQDLFATMLWRDLDKFYSEVLGKPTTLCETIGMADIWLIRTYWDFEYPRPFLPNFKFVGGLHCKPAKPLPKDMEAFVQSSGDDGIIVFSLGSMVKNLTKEKGEVIATALGQLPQKVLWRYSKEHPENLAPNTKIYDWMPQNDLLGHPKTKAFITHGGTNGVYEAIYHGVPMVGIPLFADQPDNMIHMRAKGAAVILDFNSMQSKDLVDAIRTVIRDPSYKENAMRLSRIQHDQPMTPLDQAVFWIEFVIRHKGAKHLRVQAHNLTWYQYHSLDVLAVLLTTAVLAVLLFLKTCRFCFRKCCRKSKTKSKSE